MEMKKTINIGELVTVNLGQFNNSSNTYKVEAKLKKNKFLLSNPIAPECYIIKDGNELNTVVANLKTPIENCLLFAQTNRNFLGFIMQADLDALTYFFVIKKDFSTRQKETLSNMCGKIAGIMLMNDLSSAAALIKQNLGLLDVYNKTIYNLLKPSIEDVSSIDNEFKKISIYKLAGFLLAQAKVT